ncbi:amidohydrolase [Streptomyces sp. e14]|nr:amidohydrolase [Streptomyces sp. e14]
MCTPTATRPSRSPDSNLSGAPSLGGGQAALARVREFAAARPDDRVLLGHGWDAARWPGGRPPTRAELDEATGGRPLYLSRIDVHSAVVSTALLDLTPGDLGPADGPLTAAAHHAVRAAAFGAVTAEQRTEAQRAAFAHAASLGIGSVHECGGPDISSEDDFTGLLRLAAAEPGPRVVGYWAEQDVDKARELGAVGAAGDLFADGPIGSHTACLHTPYADADHTGTAYLDAAAVAAHVVACTEAGLQAGFHAIGDAKRHRRGRGRARRRREGRPGPRPRRPAPRRARRDAHRGHRRRLRRAGPHRLRAARLRRAVGRRGRHVRAAPGRRAGPYAQPLRGAAARRRPARLRLRQPRHAARPVGCRPGRRLPPHPRAPDLRPRRLHRAHPRRLAGDRPGRRGRPGARRARRLRRVAHRRARRPGPRRPGGALVDGPALRHPRPARPRPGP